MDKFKIFIFSVLLLLLVCGVSAAIETAITPKWRRETFGKCRKRVRALIDAVNSDSLSSAKSEREFYLYHRDSSSSSAIPHVFCHYSYSVNGTTYGGSGSVPYWKAVRANRGKNPVYVSIFYDPDCPGRSCTGTEKNSVGLRRFGATALLILGIIAAMLFVPIVILKLIA